MGFEFAEESVLEPPDCESLLTGKVEVISTVLPLLEPCLDQVNILANVGSEPIEKLGGVQTLASQSGISDLGMWNGLFVRQGTDLGIIDTLAIVAEAVVLGEQAQELAAETGAQVYWQGQAEAIKRIQADRAADADFRQGLGQ